REAASQTGLRKSRGRTQEAEVGSENGHHRQADGLGDGGGGGMAPGHDGCGRLKGPRIEARSLKGSGRPCPFTEPARKPARRPPLGANASAAPNAEKEAPNLSKRQPRGTARIAENEKTHPWLRKRSNHATGASPWSS